jgi:Carboxypeptidase regulatory-like domain
MRNYRNFLIEGLLLVQFMLSVVPRAKAQGNSGTINGTVTDSTGGVVANAEVTIHNPVSQYERTATTDASGISALRTCPSTLIT